MTAPGALDLSFGSNGIVTTAIGSGGSEAGYDVALQSDGKIVVAGWAWKDSNHTDIAVARYNSDGSLDPTFDGDGIVTTDRDDDEVAHAVTVQPDGKILVAGYIYNTNNTNNNDGFIVVRYNSNGSLDSTFDGDGIVTTDFAMGLGLAFNWLNCI